MRARRIGLLAPFRELPGEYADAVAAAREPALAWQVVTEAADSHTVEDLFETGSDAVLREGVARLGRWRPTVVSFACTSGSFVGGRDWALRQAQTIERAAGVPATSTSLAFVEALGALGATAVSVVAPYPEPATEALARFLGEWGIEVRASTSLGYEGGLASEALDAADVERSLGRLDLELPVLLPDTAVWGLEIHRELAPRLPVPLLVANQVTLWNAFDLAGMATDLPLFGELSGTHGPGATRRRSATPGDA
jgi:maleate cis-trans isomerase